MGGAVAKSSLEYQKLMAKIKAAYDPGADVQVGDWIEGPRVTETPLRRAELARCRMNF